MGFLRWLVLRRARVAFRSILVGREREPGRAEAGRITRGDVDAIVDDAWLEVDALAAGARLARYPRLGTRMNAYLALATLAGYRSLRRSGMARQRAIARSGDVGWAVYRSVIRIPRAVARILRRTPQRRIDFIIGALLRFPFAPPRDPAAPGYRVRAWKDAEGMHTHWTRCPPLEVFRESCDPEELEVFRATWCRFDYAAAEEMADGGRFERPHLLSAGDPVCDMNWTAAEDVD